MKRIVVMFMAAAFTFSTATFGQDETLKKAGKSIKKGAKKAGNKTVEVGSKGVAKVQDRTYDGKVAPNGKTVYITENSRYYWVDDKGRRQYVSAGELKDKKKD